MIVFGGLLRRRFCQSFGRGFFIWFWSFVSIRRFFPCLLICFFGRWLISGLFTSRFLNILRKFLPVPSLCRLVMCFSFSRIYRRPVWVSDGLNDIRSKGHHFSFADGIPQPVGLDSRNAPKMRMEQLLVARYNGVAHQHGRIRCKKLFISTSWDSFSATHSYSKVRLPISLIALDTCTRSMPWNDVEHIDIFLKPAAS